MSSCMTARPCYGNLIFVSLPRGRGSKGDVESIASKSPKELTQLIEQISGSDEYR